MIKKLSLIYYFLMVFILIFLYAIFYKVASVFYHLDKFFHLIAEKLETYANNLAEKA